jgi:hypothetical protein
VYSRIEYILSWVMWQMEVYKNSLKPKLQLMRFLFYMRRCSQSIFLRYLYYYDKNCKIYPIYVICSNIALSRWKSFKNRSRSTKAVKSASSYGHQNICLKDKICIHKSIDQCKAGCTDKSVASNKISPDVYVEDVIIKR